MKYNLGDKKLGDEGVKILGEEKKWSFALTKLQLSTIPLYIDKNGLTAKTMICLAKQKWVKLQVLNLCIS